MPVWNDSFEKFQHLIVDNQLICAVVRIEEKEGIRRLHAHWMESLHEDVTTLMIACDQAYDQTKLLLERRKKASQMNQQQAEKNPKPQSAFKMKVDLEQVRLSSILKLKKIFRQFPGDVPVEIEFFANQQSLGFLQIESQWGIELNETLKRLILDSSQAFKV